MERVALATLIEMGTSYAGEEFATPLEVQKFSGSIPDAPPTSTNKPVIYIPTCYNFVGVDAVLAVTVKEKETKTIIVGVQITIATNHSDSKTAFMNSWREWDTLMASEDTEFRFLWIVEGLNQKTGKWEEMSAKKTTLRSGKVAG